MAMEWFIKKGNPVEESKPHEIEFSRYFAVKDGRPQSIDMEVYCDETSKTAPVHKNKNVRTLVALRGDLSRLSGADLIGAIETRGDGNIYYVLTGSVEATYYSASTKYVLLCMGKRYDTVTAEYV